MMRQEFRFSTECPDLRAVIRVLEPLILSAIESPRLKPSGGFYVSDDMHQGGVETGMHDVDDLDDAFAIFPGTPGYVSREYGTRLSRKPYYSVTMRADIRGGRNARGHISVVGPNTHVTPGLTSRLQSVIENEISRQNAGDWKLGPLREGRVESASLLKRAGRLVGTNPLVSAIVATIIGGLLLAGLVGWLGLGAGGDKKAPSPTTSTTLEHTGNPGTSAVLESPPTSSSSSVDTNQPRTRGDDQPTHTVAPGPSQG